MPRISILLAAGGLLLGTALPASAAPNPFLNTLTKVDTVASTVPANGDINRS
jgi:hypothetical protein